MVAHREALPEVVRSMVPDVRGSIIRPHRANDDEDAWYEYTACVLGSRVRQDVASSFAEACREQLLYPKKRPRRRPLEQRDFEGVLRSPRIVRGRHTRYPFPVVRAGALASSATYFYAGVAESLLNFLSVEDSAEALRRWLCRHAAGLGPKQASLFLRNAAGVEHLAVLDVHLLRYGEIVGLWTATEVRPSSITWYEKAECLLRRHAEQLGVEFLEFDVSAWVVMRAYSSLQMRVG